MSGWSASPQLKCLQAKSDTLGLDQTVLFIYILTFHRSTSLGAAGLSRCAEKASRGVRAAEAPAVKQASTGRPGPPRSPSIPRQRSGAEDCRTAAARGNAPATATSHCNQGLCATHGHPLRGPGTRKNRARTRRDAALFIKSSIIIVVQNRKMALTPTSSV
ncbi:hypothetical protein NDU88_006050 [Pleurodeles waltl]|uniref:Uncharacterized protein n=1 Tax=Pleurodeles waltl TaxID=8319 RepID=A0AAV7N2Y5_PLEWA|nr:hypothetical protein NDU88_006050 [Pleurodeles waltl]